MASQLDKFKKHLLGSSDIDVDYIGIVGPSGELKKLTGIDAVLNSWLNILRTPKGSHLYDPEFGSNLHLFLFEPVNEDTADRIREDILLSLMTYDDRASIEKIDVLFFKDKRGFVVDIAVKYGSEVKTLRVPIIDLIYPTGA
ncbi:MAG: hypothetical protein KatS3mg002_0266 [Candidatus Woesearchaeota archaeon]|nr:MAG: hypothetical protein KatS3mg002_0266 [Candidatus Woesearchaeota archaeon]